VELMVRLHDAEEALAGSAARRGGRRAAALAELEEQVQRVQTAPLTPPPRTHSHTPACCEFMK